MQLDKNQVDQIQKLVSEYGFDSRRDEQDNWPEPEGIGTFLAPVEPLPEELIPAPLRAWVADVAHRMQCPLEFAAVSAMITTAAVIGAGCGVRPKRKDDWLVVPNL